MKTRLMKKNEKGTLMTIEMVGDILQINVGRDCWNIMPEEQEHIQRIKKEELPTWNELRDR